MNVYHWDDIYDRAVAAFHGPAHFETEHTLLQHFQQDPDRVINLIDSVADDLRNGRIRSGWGILTKRLDDLKAREHVTAVSTGTRDKAIRNAETWMRNAGLHFNNWTEVEDELFGERGRLREWRDSQQLTDRMQALWQEHRPTGEQLEADELQRANHWTESQTSIKQALRKTHA